MPNLVKHVQHRAFHFFIRDLKIGNHTEYAHAIKCYYLIFWSQSFIRAYGSGGGGGGVFVGGGGGVGFGWLPPPPEGLPPPGELLSVLGGCVGVGIGVFVGRTEAGSQRVAPILRRFPSKQLTS
jgi:hypothetical protein